MDALYYDARDDIEEEALKEQSQCNEAMAEVNDDIDDLFEQKEQEYSPYKGLSFFAPAAEEEPEVETNLPAWLKPPEEDTHQEQDDYESSWQGKVIYAIDNPSETISNIASGLWSEVKEAPVKAALNLSPLGTVDSFQSIVTGYSLINKSDVSFSMALLGSIPFFGAGVKIEKEALKTWTMKGRLKDAKLPIEGKIRYIPPKGYHPSNALPTVNKKGFRDKYGNEWVKGPSRTAGQAFEWDVQLSNAGRLQLGWASRDGSHINISLDGRITHR